MKNPLDEHCFMIECEVRKEKNRLLGEPNNPQEFETLVLERIERNSVDDIVSKTSYYKRAEDFMLSNQNTLREAELRNQVLNSTSPEHSRDFRKAKKSKKQCKKSAMKYTKKLEKKQQKLNEKLVCFFSEKEIVPGALMAELMKKAERICACDKNDFALRLNSILDKDVRVRVKSTEYTEVYRQLLMSQDLKYDNVFLKTSPLSTA